jgi:hypothetical protein
MRICNLQDGLGQLAHAMTELNEARAAVLTHWNDENRRQFDETHLRPLPAQVQLLVAAVQALATSADRAARELTDGDY